MLRLRQIVRLCMAAVLMAMFIGRPAAADDHVARIIAPACHAASGLDRGAEAMIARAAWTCNETGWQADRPVAWLRFEADAWAGGKFPRHFFTRIARFQTIEFSALDADGTLRRLAFDEADGQPFAKGPVFKLALPDIQPGTRAVIVRIERPHSLLLLSEARLTHDPDAVGWSQTETMILALVVGMLILPLLFDVTFYLVLRENFVIIHACMVTAMITYVAFAGGLVSSFVVLPLVVIAIVTPLSSAIGCGLSAVFLASFLECGAQSRTMRRLTIGVGIWNIIVPGFFGLQLHATQAVDDQFYLYAFIPLLLVLGAATAEALMRGSRMARFIAFAWAPVVFAAIERMLRGFGFYTGPSSLDQMIYLATGFEVIIISLAIADRFLAIRRERDAALTEARMLEQLSACDPLTGLMNRRAIADRFDMLRQQGFDTFALLDLDQFKEVNDKFGHQIGDQALIAGADAIRGTGNRDHIAVRLGGEEFVLLLRGPRALERAEALRQAIPRRIASEVPGLNRPITASMGVIELPQGAPPTMSFDELYSRADALLYDAKASGRNRMYFERLTVFHKPPPSRREEARVKTA